MVINSSPSLCELVLNKVKEDKFTHFSTAGLFQYSNWGEAPKFFGLVAFAFAFGAVVAYLVLLTY
jgi:hypothetical protein